MRLDGTQRAGAPQNCENCGSPTAEFASMSYGIDMRASLHGLMEETVVCRQTGVGNSEHRLQKKQKVQPKPWTSHKCRGPFRHRKCSRVSWQSRVRRFRD